jgi:hypothetical protein
MGRRNYYKKVAAAILIAVAVIIVLVLYFYPAEATFYSKRMYPGQTYVAWDGNPRPSLYHFHAIYYQMYINGSVVYGSGTLETSWTCPEYLYGQEGNQTYKIGYAVAWTDGRLGT